MSKETRKKSSKTASDTPRARKTRTAAAGRPATTTPASKRKSTKGAASAASHKAPSKRLKSSESKSAPIKKGSGAGLAEGQKAPLFSLPGAGGDTAALSDYAGKKVAIFFYPRADTPGCTREAIDFTRLSSAFAKAGTVVVGISADPPTAQQRFRDKHRLGIPLLSDESHETLDAYGAWGTKSMYGKSFLGILRTTVLIGVDGRVARIWRNVRVDGHADEVLAAATEL
jgi:peroxiredoxin Q/BCP